MENISHTLFPDIMLEIEARRRQYISVEPVRVYRRMYRVRVRHCCVYEMLMVTSTMEEERTESDM